MLALVAMLGACVDDFVATETETGGSETGETAGEDPEVFDCEPATPLESEPPVLGWQTDLGSNNDDVVTDLAVAADGSVIVVGRYAPIDDFDYDAFATKLDAEGNEQWSLTWSEPSTPTTSDGVEITADGTILILGSNDSDLTLTGLTPDGSELWRHEWDGTVRGASRALALGPTGRIYVGTETTYEVHVSQVTEAGEIEWDTSLSWGSTNILRGLAAACDGSIYMAGGYVDKDYWMDDGDGVVAKLDGEGNLLWEVFSQVGIVDEYVDVALVGDAIFAIGNEHEDLATENTGSSFINRIDPAGELLWTEYVSPPQSMGAIAALGDGVVVGHAPDNLVLYAADGQVVWETTTTALGNGRNLALALGPDASLVLAASKYDGETPDIVVSRLDQP